MTLGITLAAAACTSTGGTSEKGESCTKTADCVSGLRCVNNVCIDENAPDPKEAFGAWLDKFGPAFCEWQAKCFPTADKAKCLASLAKGSEVYQDIIGCQSKVNYYTQHRAALDACLTAKPACGSGDDPDDFCAAVGEMGEPDKCATAQPDGGTSGTGIPTTPAARFVGAWKLTSTCTGSNDVTEYAVFFCPGGHVRGAGKWAGGFIESICGTYTAKAAPYSNCTDKIGCFPRADTNHKSVLGKAGVTDTKYNQKYVFYSLSKTRLLWNAYCAGSNDLVTLERVTGTVTKDDCASSTCSGSGSGGTWGKCGTDCDCGYCWYCDSGSCRYGGQGPYGCYRGCPWK